MRGLVEPQGRIDGEPEQVGVELGPHRVLERQATRGRWLHRDRQRQRQAEQAAGTVVGQARKQGRVERVEQAGAQTKILRAQVLHAVELEGELRTHDPEQVDLRDDRIAADRDLADAVAEQAQQRERGRRDAERRDQACDPMQERAV